MAAHGTPGPVKIRNNQLKAKYPPLMVIIFATNFKENPDQPGTRQNDEEFENKLSKKNVEVKNQNVFKFNRKGD